MLMPRNFVLVVKGIILPSITIEFSSILTRFCLVLNSIATVLLTFMCNLCDLSHYDFRHFHINSFYYGFCIGIFIKNVSIVSTKKELWLRTYSWKVVNV